MSEVTDERDSSLHDRHEYCCSKEMMQSFQNALTRCIGEIEILVSNARECQHSTGSSQDGSNQSTTSEETHKEIEEISTAPGGKTLEYWISPRALKRFKKRLNMYERKCDEMKEELGHLAKHFEIVGGDKDVIMASNDLSEALSSLVKLAKKVLDCKAGEVRRKPMWNLYSRGFEQCLDALIDFRKALYQQRHAFYFRAVSKWEVCLNGYPKIFELFDWDDELEECFDYICGTIFPNLETEMKAVGEELKLFGERSLPTFLADEKERATTRYVNITTIATFFSSVTATTLQFSLPDSNTPLGSLVNFFWFLSLVFSVSSGISSLLGMTWRKSSIYDSHPAPVMIKIWLDKAPIIFLVVAAVMFVVGLNLFVYTPSQSQARYVSMSTNVFTGVHSLCLLVTAIWFIYQLKHDTAWAGWFRTGRDFTLAFIKASPDFIWSFLQRLPGECGFLAMMVFLPISMPIILRMKGGKCLHLRRNIYWSFGLDTHVIRLSWDIFQRDAERDAEGNWPSPFVVAKCIRKAVLSFRAVQKTFVRRTDSREEEEGETEGKATRDEALNEYRRILRSTFSDETRIDHILEWVEYWTSSDWNDSDFGSHLRNYLWGYPELVYAALNVKPRMQSIEKEREKGRPGLKNRRSSGRYVPITEGALISSDSPFASPTPVSQVEDDNRRMEGTDALNASSESGNDDVGSDGVQEIVHALTAHDEHSYPDAQGSPCLQSVPLPLDEEKPSIINPAESRRSSADSLGRGQEAVIPGTPLTARHFSSHSSTLCVYRPSGLGNI